jgi:hypothetical protein
VRKSQAFLSFELVYCHVIFPAMQAWNFLQAWQVMHAIRCARELKLSNSCYSLSRSHSFYPYNARQGTMRYSASRLAASPLCVEQEKLISVNRRCAFLVNFYYLKNKGYLL